MTAELIGLARKGKRKLTMDMACARFVGDEVPAEIRKRRLVASDSGASQLQNLVQMLDGFGMRRSMVQKQLHRGMIGAVMQRIYEHDSDAEMRAGMVSNSIKSSRQQFMAITPRRFGKTTAVSMFVAAFALCVPGSVTAIFSTGRRASNLLLQQIKAMVSCIPGAENQIVSSNVETLVIQSGEKLSKISSFPGKARTLRGTGGDLVILEEAAFIAPEVWTEVVIPLIEVKNTALVAISTPLDSSNFYSTLVTMKDERGEPIFHVLEARAACEKCIQTLDDPSKCPHVNLERPQWKSKEKQQVVKALYSGNQEMLLRESMGVVTEGSGGVFLKQCVKHLFDKSRTQLPAQVHHCYTAIDPTGGGPSCFAIVSLLRINGAIQVCQHTPSLV